METESSGNLSLDTRRHLRSLSIQYLPRVERSLCDLKSWSSENGRKLSVISSEHLLLSKEINGNGGLARNVLVIVNVASWPPASTTFPLRPLSPGG